jgi:DMSO/TMAO reductase YedYZ molybdopterin-dependent catalytic subunit
MRRSRKGIVVAVLLVALVLALAGLAVAGCGSDTTETTATTAAATATTAATTATTAAATPTTAGGSDTTAAGTATTAGAGGPAKDRVEVSGLVDSPTTFTAADLEKLGTVTATLNHPKKGDVEYTGVTFAKLIEAVKVQAAAKTMLLSAVDGYTVEVALTDIKPEAMLGIADGAFSAAFPGLDGKSWARDIVTIKFQ